MQRDANNTEIVLFTVFFVFVLHGHKAEECNLTTYSARSESVHILDKLHWCHGNVCIMRNFGYIWLSDMRIFVGQVLHICTKSTLQMSYLGCFSFLSARDIW